MSLPDPAFEAWLDQARSTDILETGRRLQPALKRAGNDWNAACPTCGGADKNEFIITPRNRLFLCRKSGEAGDAIKMVEHALGCDFVAAVEWINGTPPPRGESRAIDPEMIRERREDRHRDRIEAARDERKRDTNAILTARDVFALGRDILGTQGEGYFRARGIVLTPDLAVNLRFVPALEYRGYPDADASEEAPLGTYPCVLAAYRDLEGDVVACQRIYLDRQKPVALAPPGDRQRNRKKKIMGRPVGSMSLMGYAGGTVAIGEGTETVASWFQLYDGLADVTPASAYSMGNMAGNATGTLPHPKATTDQQARIPNGEPDMERPGVILPPEVTHVVLIGDGDSDPARTRAFVLTAGRRYRAEGREVSVSFAPDGTDWNDQLVRQVAGEPVEPPALQPFEEFEVEALALMRPPFRSSFGATWLHEVGGSKPVRNWLVKDLMLCRSFGVVYGPPGSGKSFLVSDLMLSCAAVALPHQQQTWFGYRMRHFGVVYVVAEGRDDFEIRLHAWRRENSIPDGAVIPFVFLPTSIDMRSSDADTIKMANEINQLDALMMERCGVGIGAVVIDTVARALAGGNENASEVMGAFVINCGKLADLTGASVIGVHHGGKEAGRGPRGHEALHGAADFEFEVAPAGDGEPNAWTVRKLKAGPGGATHKFRLKQISVGIDEDGDKVTSCVVIDTEAQDAGQPQVPKRTGFKINDTEREWLQAFDQAIERVGIMPPAGVEVSSNVHLVVATEEVKRVYKERFAATEDGDDETVDARLRQRWSRATKGLLKFRIIGTTKTHVWMTGRAVLGHRLKGATEIKPDPKVLDQPITSYNDTL